MGAYSQVKNLITLGVEDTGSLAQVLHSAQRKLPDGRAKNSSTAQRLLVYAEDLVTDIRQDKLTPSPAAHLHLLSFYKEGRHFDQGRKFWDWLVQQDDSFVTASVYGAAIELLAVMGCRADETEAIYSDGLRRFPGAFNEYHLSPNSIVTDRTQPINIKGIPTTLLQGIVVARLLQGNAKDAYLGLDTALRLFPTQVPKRLYVSFIQERPVTEAYKVFLVACRSGTEMGQEALKVLLAKMRDAIETDLLPYDVGLRAMLVAACTHVCTLGRLNANHLFEIATSIMHTMPRSAAIQSPEVRQQYSDSILDTLGQLFIAFSVHGVRPGVAVFNAMISKVAARSKRKELLHTCVSRIRTGGLQPNAVTYRCLLKTAGDLQDAELLRESWSALVRLSESSGSPTSQLDWKMLVQAAVNVKDTAFIEEQMEASAHAMTPSLEEHVRYLMNTYQPSSDLAVNATDERADTERAARLRSKLSTDIQILEERCKSNDVLNFRAQPMPMSLGQASHGHLDEAAMEEVRQLYEQVSTDKRSSDLLPAEGKDEREQEREQEQLPPAMSSTGFPLDELRFQNWQAINELLAEAKYHDDNFSSAVEKAIMDGRAPPERTSLLRRSYRNAMSRHGTGLSECFLGYDGALATSSERIPVSPWQSLSSDPNRILDLRGRN